MPKKIRVKVVGSGTKEDPYRVDLPTYNMLGSEKLAGEKLVSVEVLVPSDECDEHGKLDEAKIRKKYRNHLQWDKEGSIANAIIAAEK